MSSHRIYGTVQSEYSFFVTALRKNRKKKTVMKMKSTMEIIRVERYLVESFVEDFVDNQAMHKKNKEKYKI